MRLKVADFGSGSIRFDGRVAIITGAGRGLGRSHALLLSRLGAAVVVNDVGTSPEGKGISASPAEEVVSEIQAAGGRAMCDFSDVSSHSEMERLVDATLERFGRLDIVIANAGITLRAPFGDLTPEQFDQVLRVHLYGTFNIAHCAWPHLQKRGYGRIVVTTSIAGLVGRPASAGYSTAKMGIIGLMRSLADEGRAYGIGVNAIAPVAFTRLVEEALPDGEAKERFKALAPPGGASQIYAWLAHESCDITGEIFGSAGEQTTRVFVGETPSHTITTPEQMRDHSQGLIDETNYVIHDDYAACERFWVDNLGATA